MLGAESQGLIEFAKIKFSGFRLYPVPGYFTETNDIESATEFPFTLMKTDLPFMPSPFVGEFLKVEAVCQWDEVGDSWTSLSGAIEGLWDSMKSMVSSFF